MDDEISVDVNPEIVGRLVSLAHAFHAREEVCIPDRPLSPSSDWATQILADHKDDSTYSEFVGLIDSLEPDQQIFVVALMWLGRGDFTVEEWDAAIQDASDNWHDNTADYLLAHPLLASDLEAGLDMLGYEPEDYETA